MCLSFFPLDSFHCHFILTTLLFCQVDFKLTGKKTKPTPKGLPTREWTHRLLKNYTFLQPMNDGGKTWNTGVWNKRLDALANGDKAEKNIVVIARAKFLLRMRKTNGNRVAAKGGLKDDVGYYSFEEDLEHHVREAMVILSTGCPMSFFNNPFVKEWLRHLDPKHRPVYRLKLLRIIRCINDVLNNEVKLSFFSLIPREQLCICFAHKMFCSFSYLHR